MSGDAVPAATLLELDLDDPEADYLLGLALAAEGRCVSCGRRRCEFECLPGPPAAEQPPGFAAATSEGTEAAPPPETS